MGDWLFPSIGVLASLVGTIYLLQVFWPRIRSLTGQDRGVEARTRELLQKHREDLADDWEGDQMP